MFRWFFNYLSSDNEHDHQLQLLLDESVLLYCQVLSQQDIGDPEAENGFKIKYYHFLVVDWIFRYSMNLVAFSSQTT